MIKKKKDDYQNTGGELMPRGTSILSNVPQLVFHHSHSSNQLGHLFFLSTALR